MNERTKQGLQIIGGALSLGVLGDALLRAPGLGLNFFLLTCALAAATVVLLKRWRRAALKSEGSWLLLPIIAGAGACVWRDSPTLQLLDVLAVLSAFGLLAARARGKSVRFAGLSDYARGLAGAGLSALFGSVPLVFTDVRWCELPRTNWTRHATAVARGLLIAVPLLVVFGALFMAADAVFAGLINRTFRFDTDALFSHGLLLSTCAWLSAGYLRGLLFTGPQLSNAAPVTNQPPANTADTSDDTSAPRTPPASVTSVSLEPRPAPSVLHDSASPDTPRAPIKDARDKAARNEREQSTRSDRPAPFVGTPTPQFALGAVEVGVALGALNALFFGFVCVQVRYLFGGAAWVAATGGLTYAEYARRGFFELVWATALVLPLLLALHWLLRRDDALALRIFRLLALVQIALLFVVIASAVTRMRLYQREYGLTELRLYTMAFMGWLALVFVWFAATVLRGARARFACGALVSALLVIGALHLLNPDAAIVRANLAHARTGRAFDAGYATTLSADAVPTLVRALPGLTQDARCLAARELLARWSSTDADWRAWNVARSDAEHAVAAQAESLHAWACAPPVEPISTTTMPAASEVPMTAAPAQTTVPDAGAQSTTDTQGQIKSGAPVVPQPAVQVAPKLAPPATAQTMSRKRKRGRH